MNVLNTLAAVKTEQFYKKENYKSSLSDSFQLTKLGCSWLFFVGLVDNTYDW